MSKFVGIDVGGTSTRIALCAHGPDGRWAVVGSATALNRNFPSFEALAADLMGRLGVCRGSPHPIGVAAAGVIRDGVYVVHPDYPGGELDTSCFGAFGPVTAVINDFEAQAWSLCTSTLDLTTHVSGPREHRVGGVRLVIGPGTGLGVAGLEAGQGVDCERVIRSEGGHGTIPFQFEEQLPFFRFLIEHPDAVRHSGKMCTEAVLSGGGLSLIHQFHTGNYVDPMSVGDQVTEDDLRLFALHLGLTCRQMVATFTGFAGLYLTGGVLRRTQMLTQPAVLSQFKRGLCSSVRHAEALENTPVWLLTDDNGGALGAAYAAMIRS